VPPTYRDDVAQYFQQLSDPAPAGAAPRKQP
jgi:hypothetical protein